MPDNPRIEELRRRVAKDPASIAFAQLAEEYRRAGRYEDAIATCRAGLGIHPGYVSARVTLGRALIEVNDLDGAQAELMYVIQHAPENLAAIRGMAEIHHRRGELSDALTFYQSALGLAQHDPDLEQTVDEISRSLAPKTAAVAHAGGLSFAEASAEFLSALDELSVAVPPAPPTPPTPPTVEPAVSEAAQPFEPLRLVEKAESEPLPVEAFGALAPAARGDALLERDPALLDLERFLDAIHTYRQRKAV